MYSSAATGVAGAGGLGKKRSLVDKLQARHQAALVAFRDSITELNRGIDEEQLCCLTTLKSELANSHAESEAVLAEERRRVESHECVLEGYAQRLTGRGGETPDNNARDDEGSTDNRVRDGDVLPQYRDFLFSDITSAAGGDTEASATQALAEAQAAMKAERLRMLERAVLLRRLHRARTAAIGALKQRLEAAEVRRREAIQALLRELMLSLAKISYCSVTASHVLAQRALHGANEQISMNVSTTHILLSQLGQREVLKQRVYATDMASLLLRSRSNMARSVACWARTLLQSAVFRRPANRMAVVERVSAVSARARRDGRHFLQSLSAVVATLRSTNDKGIVLAPSAGAAGVEEEGSTLDVPPQVECGGVGASGWLRLYSPDPYTDPFPCGCDEVVDEWRMKVTVVLGNTQAACQEVANEVRRREEERWQAVEAVRRALRSVIDWLHVPLEEELPLLAAASLLLPAEEEEAAGEADGRAMDSVFSPFSEVDTGALAAAQAESERILGAVSEVIQREGGWFASIVEMGLKESYKAFEHLLAAALTSVLRWFERSTHELVDTTRDALNPLRSFYVRRCEAQKDTEDDMARREAAFRDVCDRLGKACSLTAAEALFTEGLQQLDAIAAVYTSRQQHTTADLRSGLAGITEAAAVSCGRLMEKLGLESVEATQARFEAARQEKLEAALAEVMREYQQQQQQQQQTSHSTVNASGTSTKRRGASKKDAASAAASAAPLDAEAAALYQEQQVLALSQLEEQIRLEVIEYPQIVSTRGSVFNVIAPFSVIDEEALARAAEAAAAPHQPSPPMPSPPPHSAANAGDAPAAGGASTRSSKRALHAAQSKTPPAVTAPAADAAPTPEAPAAAADEAAPAEFVSTYTPMMSDTILTPSHNFLTEGDVEAWKARLREELLNWLLALRHSVEDVMRRYCAKAREEVEQQTSELLRRHRRRPAALQADVFEARVRELEDAESASERHAQRYRERLVKLAALWRSFAQDPELAAKAESTRKEMGDLEAQAATAASLSALQSQDRRHNALCTSYADGFAKTCEALLATIAAAKASLEEECCRCLKNRAGALAEEELGEGVTLEQAIADDVTSTLVREVLADLETTDAAIRAEAAAIVKERQVAAEAARARYAALFASNAAELQLLAKVQEAFSWLKTQQHSLQMSLMAEEEVLVEAVAALEREVARSIPRLALPDIVHQQLQREDAGGGADNEAQQTAATSEGGPLSPETVEALLTSLNGELQQTRVATLRETRSCALSNVFEGLSGLRMMLYTRGASLDSLAYSVELIQLTPAFLVEPQAVVKEVSAGGSAGPSAAGATASGNAAASGGKGAGGSRRVRSVAAGTTPGSVGTGAGGRAAAQQVQLLPLPPVLSATAQFSKWAAQTRDTVERLVAAHVAQHPPPLHRRLPGADLVGASEGALPDPIAAARVVVDAFCHAQEERLLAFVAQSKKTYYQHVHRVYDAVLTVPRVAAASLHTLTSSAVEQRLGHVLHTYGRFTSRSLALKEVHRRSVKVSLSAKANAETLSRLVTSEAARQQLTRDTTDTFWGLALREVQDESDQHAARCYTATTTFFSLLRGLVTPERLVPYEWDNAAVHHRGLKHLLKMRARQDAEMAEVREEGILTSANGKRDRRPQETLPPSKQLQDASGAKVGSAGSAAAANAGAPSSAVLSPALLHPAVAFSGLPLLRVKPLDGFNAAHPSCSVAPLNTVYAYFPGLAEAEAAAKAAAAGGGAATATGPNAAQQGGGGGRKSVSTGKQRSADPALAYGAEGAPPVTPAIHAFSSRLHRDTIGAVRDTVEVINRDAAIIVDDVNCTFQCWEGREDSWRRSWQAMVCQLQGGESAAQAPVSSSGAAGSNSNSGGGGGGGGGAAGSGGGGTTSKAATR